MMNIVVLISIYIVGSIAASIAAPVPSTRCSPIIPEENCRNALSATEAGNLAGRIISEIDNINNAILQPIQRNLTDTRSEPGPYRSENTTTSDYIARSVYRLKCEVPLVADIVKSESIRELVLEESSYATEFKDLLEKMRILFDLKTLVSRYRPLNSCVVPETECPIFSITGLDRLVVIRSTADDIFRLLADLGEAIEITNF